MPAQAKAGGKAGHKFGAVATERDGIRFDSKAEAAYYDHLLLLQAAGEVIGFTRQTPFHLPGGTRHVVDFLVFWIDGDVTAEDVKGHETAEFKVKAREVVAAYRWMTFRKVKRAGQAWAYSPYAEGRG